MASTIANGRQVPVPVRAGPGAVTRAAVDLPSCGRGQALDACHSGHCPRCGVRLGPSRRVEGF